MENHYELSDREFESQFAKGTFNPALFSHAAHLRLAWIHVTKYGETIAIQNITDQLKQFVTIVGAEDKYNHTLTVAAVKAVHHFVKKSQSTTFYDFINEFPRLKYNFKELMAVHYGLDIYNLPEAKAEFIEPDLVAFD
ncbi:MAG: hypothetical protein HYZ44_06835 [Bacteroidetes bacterium]|nr:hypothetical protein [Bacteroidota bacterium]